MIMALALRWLLTAVFAAASGRTEYPVSATSTGISPTFAM